MRIRVQRSLALALFASAIATIAVAQGPAPDSGRRAATTRIAAELAVLKLTGQDGQVPPADSFTTGDRLIPAGSTVHGPVGVADGRLEIYGEVDGSAVDLGGDIIVHRGGIVTGDAVSVGGKVVVDGGRVDGERNSVQPAVRGGLIRFPRSAAPMTTWDAVKLALGWFAVLAIIGIGVLMFAEVNLDGVVASLQGNPVRSFWMGVLAQIALLPALFILVLALALTILGVLLIPFAIVAYAIAAAGVITLGFLAVSRLTGGALVGRGGSPATRSVHLTALAVGLILYGGLWVVAAALTNVAIAGGVIRGLAIAVTWVAASAGLGAVIVSRAGTHREAGATRARRAPADELSWQTPTPITGVAAARRPVAPTRAQP